MGQSKRGSALEAGANIVVGMAIGFYANLYLLPLFGVPISTRAAFDLNLVFTAISLVRSYVIRRIYNRYGSLVGALQEWLEAILVWMQRRLRPGVPEEAIYRFINLTRIS